MRGVPFKLREVETYSGKYTDARGSESISIENDGHRLSFKLRGVHFSGDDFDSFEPTDETSTELLAGFTLDRNGLCDCTLECDIPVSVVENCEGLNGIVRVYLELEGTDSNGGVYGQHLRLSLHSKFGVHDGDGSSSWFEDELNSIQSKLPSGVFIRCCINCQFSDYSPYGHGMFGCMMCFRNMKGEYAATSSKKEFLLIHDQYEDIVQETFLCSDFQRRVPGTGYRG